MQPFAPAWFARGAHRQTLWASLFRRRVPLQVRRERLELPDGDFVDLDWHAEQLPGPIVVLLHGLQGSIDSHYIRGMMRGLECVGLRSVLMHFRGCSGPPNRLPRAYHSGDTGDISLLVDRVRSEYPNVPLAAIGYSLGANVLLKWMGQTGVGNPLRCAAAVSPPFELGPCADYISRGFSRVYESYLLKALLRSLHQKRAMVDLELPITEAQLRQLRTIRAFDEHITAPLHGFAGAEDYYTQSSCRQFLRGIARPTLILHARNDPFMTPAVIPHAEELSKNVSLELSDDGGHVGFVAGRVPWQAEYWLERRIPDFLAAQLAAGD